VRLAGYEVVDLHSFVTLSLTKGEIPFPVILSPELDERVEGLHSSKNSVHNCARK
jgi:hypothetical protein